MARRFPETGSIKRRKPSLDIKKKIYIICEGECTEPDYITNFARKNKHPLVEFDIMKKGGGIRLLVQKMLTKTNELKRATRKSSDSFASQFEVWGVSDVDEHPYLKEAIGLKKEHNLNLVVSNPCFEIWGVFHFEQHDGYIHRHDCQKHLKTLMPNYCHKSNPYFDFVQIQDDYKKAKSYAKKSLERRDAEGVPLGNPSTNMFELLDKIVNPFEDESNS